MIGLETLGFVLLAVTGGEALYAGPGHKPIQTAWLCLVLPALTINYFGQGALVLAHPEAIANPFYRLIPDAMLVPMVVLATAATAIASQAVITGRSPARRFNWGSCRGPRSATRRQSSMDRSSFRA